MKHSLLRIFLAASLAFMPFSPGMAAVNVMSDEDLGAVNAKGFEGQGAVPQSSYSAIQAFGAAQWYASALSIENTADAGTNLFQNVSILKDVGDIWLFSKSCQFAYNGKGGSSTKTNDNAVQGQNNNLGSVQLNDNALYGASALSIVNAAASARNMYQKFRTIENADDVTVVRFSNQMAYKWGTFEQTVTNKKGATDQTNNNASIQIGGRAQASISSAALTNLAGSGQNVSQMWTGIKNSEDVFLLQSSAQYVDNEVASEQTINNLTTICPGAVVYRNQHNNNGSIQLGGEGQSLVQSFLVSNAAVSAVNIGQNMVYAEKVKGLSAIQTNDQYADNDNNIAQTVNNDGSMEGQNNNSTSVQAFGYSQASSQPGLLVNAAGSAVNEGLNIVSAALTGGKDCHRHGHEIFFTQNNDQDADSTLDGAGQAVGNFRQVAQQSNNFGAVQMNENAQNWISAVAVTNAASSAVNVGQNFVFLAGGEYFTSICQLNDQTAENHISDGAQGVLNWDDVENQNNNNASAQIGGGAQSCVDVVSLANVAGSAANIGQNFASITGGKEVRVHQANYQNATSTTGTVQMVYNRDDVQNQNNNNGSVQLAAAQNKATSNSILNAAVSAVNIGQNIAQADVSKEAFVRQHNDQNMQVSSVAEQYVTNRDEVEQQYNNNASVQLSDAQNETKGLSILNAAASAVNVGQNVAAVVAKGAKVYQKNNNQTAVLNVNQNDPTIDNERGAKNQYNNSSSVYGTGSGSQKQVEVLSLANVAASAVGIGQNVADVKADKWAYTKQKNDQSVWSENLGLSQTVYNDRWIRNQNNNNASVQGDDLQNNMTAGSIMNAALSAVNLGQNIAKVDAGKWMEVRQINKQDASVTTYSTQTVDNDTRSVVGQNNNNASVQLIASQGGVKAISLANLAATAANVGQNVALLESGKEIDDSKQVNVQSAHASSGTTQVVDNDGSVSGQNNNSASVQLSGSQNDAVGVSILNAAVSAVNVGQNIAKASAGKEVELKQVNVQTADDPGTSSGNTSNLASVQHGSSQNNANGLSLLDAVRSSANIGQNVVSASAKWADNRQVNEQEALIAPTVSFGGGLIRVTDSETGMKALSSANVAVSAANIGQNIAKVQGAKVADLDQVNEQYALYGLEVADGSAPSSVAAIQLANSQNDVKALSLLNASFSAVDVGQNIAKVDAALFAHVDQVNCQTAMLDFGSGTVTEAAAADDNTSSPQAATTWSIGLNGSQNNTSALSIVNAAASLVNVGQNIAKVDPLKFARVDQVNDQTATIISADGTSNYGLIDLTNSQNNTSALSIVNAAASLVNVGMNIAVVEGKHVDVNQVNFQCATAAAPVSDQAEASTTTSTSAVTGGSSTIRLADSQVNTSALAIVNAAGSAANIARNIAVMNGVRGGSLTQMNFQNAYR